MVFASRKRIVFAAVAIFMAAYVLQASDRILLAGEGRKMADSPFPQRHRVPPLPEGLTWLNVAGPIELKDLRGKFVLLDFWTYCCINCMHILPELKKLEKAYPDNVVVIGVHSAKFETEQDSKNISEAILRYKIEHPVINDSDHALWKRFGVSSWPTLLLIDPEGYAVWGISGETTFAQLDKVFKAAVPFYRKKGLLDETPVRFDLEVHKAVSSPLSFPGKILADEQGGRLFIADSNHNRIVVAGLDGKLVAVIGSGVTGRADGDYSAAQFNQPQGMALRGETLYVADTENHLLRKVDMAAKTVTTIAGLGHQSREAPPFRSADPRRTALNSPWDLCIVGDSLYIAMAGPHQIWRMRLDRPTINVYAGNGREDIVDGPLVPTRLYELGASSFAQPSGLATDGTWLYVADSEGSSIRAVPLDARKEVRTVLGTSRLPAARLFTFGDVDGPAGQARLQHPLGVVYHDGKLFVADTYNNKVKILDPQTGGLRTLVGAGKPGRTDNPAAFDERAGISAAAGKLFVADTNNHLIRAIDLGDNRVTTLSIAGLDPPKPPAEESAVSARLAGDEEQLDPVTARPQDGRIRFAVEIKLPAGYKMNDLAPMSYRVDAIGDSQGVLVSRDLLGKSKRLEKPAPRFEIDLPVGATAGQFTLRIAVNYFYCRSGAEGLCKMGTAAWKVPVRLSQGAETVVIELRHQTQ